jgi:CPA2 family monovalent cation:H+ antiporter-2
MDEKTIMLEIGAMLLVAFAGALIASKAKQSVILGYIIAGILIGPFIHFSVGPFTYNGLVQDTDFVETISQLGLILLIFFVGMEFSVDKIRRVKGPAVILSIIDVGVNLFTGILLATALGWPLVDTIFLSAVLAMSCSAVAMKTLMELGRLERPETEFMLGMIILEEFISMVFLTVVGGLVIHTDASFSLGGMLLGMAVFFVFFIVMAAVIIPRAMDRLQRMKSDEMFVLFMLGIICLSAALAELCGVPALIGAFFVGMTFAETKVMKRSEKIITPLRDAFVAMFFVSFGMLIDPSMFGEVLGIILVAVALIVLDEIFIMSAVAYLVGFGRRAATSVGASFSARGGESIMYASVGSHAAGATKGAELYPIAGAVTFIMSALCPLFIRAAYPFADMVARKGPRSMVYGGAVISRTLGKLVMPGPQIVVMSRRLLWSLVAYLVLVLVMIAVPGDPKAAVYVAATATCLFVWYVLQKNLVKLVGKVDYTNLGTLPDKEVAISRFIAAVVCLSLLLVVNVAFVFALYWPAVLVIMLAYLLWFIHLLRLAYQHTCDARRYAEIRQQHAMPQVTVELEKPTYNHRQRWKDL